LPPDTVLWLVEKDVYRRMCNYAVAQILDPADPYGIMQDQSNFNRSNDVGDNLTFLDS
jgi:hypothetical protein